MSKNITFLTRIVLKSSVDLRPLNGQFSRDDSYYCIGPVSCCGAIAAVKYKIYQGVGWLPLFQRAEHLTNLVSSGDLKISRCGVAENVEGPFDVAHCNEALVLDLDIGENGEEE